MLNKIISIILFVFCVAQSMLLYKAYNVINEYNAKRSIINTDYFEANKNIDKEIKRTVCSGTINVHHEIESMRADLDLKTGMTVKTTGYYKINDGGAALYIIRKKRSDDIDDGGSIILLKNRNIAELINDGRINIKQFGAVGDGATDDTKSIKNAIAFGMDIIVPKGTYLISETIVLERKTLHGDSQSWGKETEFLSKADIAFHLKGYNNLNNITITRKDYPGVQDNTKGIWLEGAFNRLNNVNVNNKL